MIIMRLHPNIVVSKYPFQKGLNVLLLTALIIFDFSVCMQNCRLVELVK